jgi:PAS domain S-box-containing protein
MSQGIPTLSEAVSRAVLVSAPQGILVVDRTGRIVLVNAQAEELFAHPADELVGQSVGLLLPELFRGERLKQAISFEGSPAQRQEPAALKERGLCKDGTELLLEVNLVPVESPEGPLVCCVIRKTANRQQADHEMREIEDRFRLMVENSHDIMTVRDADGKVRYTSPSINRIMGYTQEQMVGSTGFELIHPEERSTVENALREFWKNPGARGTIQFRAKHATGSWISIEVVAYNLLDHPAIRGVVINGRDISERKQNDADNERRMIAELQEAAANSNTMASLLCICASCKNIRNERGEWEQIETYVRDHSQVEFSHSMCPACAKRWYPDHCGN